MKKYLVNLLILGSLLNQALAAVCSLNMVMVSAGSPYGNNPATYIIPQNLGAGAVLAAGEQGNPGVVQGTVNHIVPKGLAAANHSTIRQLFAAVSEAGDANKRLFVEALKAQVIAGLGAPQADLVGPVNQQNFTLRYQNSLYGSAVNSTAVIIQVNRLLAAYNLPFIHIGGKVQQPAGAKQALVDLQHSQNNTPGSDVAITIASQAAENAETLINGNNQNLCNNLRGEIRLFSWNPANLFLTPISSNRSWDPVLDQADMTDSWAGKIAPNKLEASNRWQNLGHLNPATLNPDQVAQDLANAIAGDGHNNINMANAKNNILLWNGLDPANQAVVGIPFIANQWSFNQNPGFASRVWCHANMMNVNECFVR